MREIRDRIDVIFLHGKADQDEYHALLRERWALQEKCPHEGMIDSKPTCPVCGKILCVR
jgi:rRNA maturation protein Nop10